MIGLNFCTSESHPRAIKIEQVPAAFVSEHTWWLMHSCTLSCFAGDPLWSCILSSILSPVGQAKLFGHECQYNQEIGSGSPVRERREIGKFFERIRIGGEESTGYRATARENVDFWFEYRSVHSKWFKYNTPTNNMWYPARIATLSIVKWISTHTHAHMYLMRTEKTNILQIPFEMRSFATN